MLVNNTACVEPRIVTVTVDGVHNISSLSQLNVIIVALTEIE